MENNPQKNLWFRAKRYGYGWTPSSWEGWLVIVLFFAVVFLAVNWGYPAEMLGYFFFIMAAALTALLAACIAKGETAHWYWGNRPAEPLCERNHWSVFLLFLMPLMLLIPGIALSLSLQEAAPGSPTIETSEGASYSGARLNLNGGETVLLEIADTPALRAHGLSGHAPLSQSQGMLFIFPQPARDGFWMKDMLFSIDMVWLDSNYRVITIKQNATPDSFPQVFSPAAPASYVLELPAGFSAAHGIAVGSVLDLVR